MSIIRVQHNKENPYVLINNTGLNDENLSFKAKGILSYLLSKPDNWKCQVNDLTKKSKDGRDSVYAGLKELRENGYMIKRPIKNDKNVIEEWEEVLFETPQEEAITIYKDQKIKNELAALKRAETIKQKNQKPLTGNPYMEEATYGKAVNGESVNGKAVDIINTNLTNTDLQSTNLLVVEAIQQFEDNICELKKTTKEQFINYCSELDIEFVKSIINLCAESGTKYFSGFKIIIDGYISKGILSKENLETYVAEYRAESKKLRDKEREKRKDRAAATASNKNKPTKGSFNDYEQRSYDFDELEAKLLGWDN